MKNANETKPRVPALRFPEFVDCGEWEEKKLGELAKNLDSKRVPITSSNRTHGKIPYYGASGVVDYVDKYIFNENLLCISEDGANLIARIYPIAFSISGKTWVNNHAHVLQFDDIRTQQYIESYINHIDLEDYITGIAQPKLNKANLEIIPIPISGKKKEQQKIAECLTALDEHIALQIEKLNALKAHKKGLLQKLFPAAGATVPELRFAEFVGAGDWEENTVDSIFNLQDGYAFSSGGFTSFSESTIQVIRISEINNKNNLQDRVYIDKYLIDSLNLSKYIVMNGDLLLSLTGASGFNFFIWNSDPAILNQRTMKIFAKRHLDYFKTVLLPYLIHTKINMKGTGQNNNLSKDLLKNISFYCPKNIKEQQRIADCLTSLDDLITAQTEKIDLLKEHKKGLLQQLFPQIERR